MGFKINPNFEEDFMRGAREKVKEHFEQKGFTVVQSTADGKNSLCKLYFKDIKEFYEEYIQKEGVDKVDWETIKKQTDLPEWFMEKYKEYLK